MRHAYRSPTRSALYCYRSVLRVAIPRDLALRQRLFHREAGGHRESEPVSGRILQITESFSRRDPFPWPWERPFLHSLHAVGVAAAPLAMNGLGRLTEAAAGQGQTHRQRDGEQETTHEDRSGGTWDQ